MLQHVQSVNAGESGINPTLAGTRRAPRSLPRVRRALRFLVVLSLTVASAIAAQSPPAQAAPAFPHPTCRVDGGLRICTAQVPSFDGTLLDVDLSFPDPGSGSTHPLMVLLHGFGNDKREWESTTDEADGADKWRWNSHWFARHGYYVLTYTARGFATQPPTEPHQPATPSGTSRLTSPSATIHLKSTEFEVRDTQWLAALAAAILPDLDRSRVAVSGGSYGGGESWLLASEPAWTFPHSVDSRLPVLSLTVAVPKYPWTDLAHSLAPNGRLDSRRGTPFGVVKQSYTAGLFALGNATGVFEQGTSTTPSREGPINLTTWFTRVMTVGDPYPGADPIVAQVRRGLTEFRSAHYQNERWQAQAAGRKVAVYSISGWTDDLFPVWESFRMFNQLKALDSSWPVSVVVADVGHAPAQNRPDTWRAINERAWRFLNDRIDGNQAAATGVVSLPTTCGVPGAGRIEALTPAGLTSGQLTVAYATTASLTSAGGAADPNGPATDPLGGSPGCRVSPGPAIGGYTGISDALSSSLTYVGLGWVEVRYAFVGETGQLNARVWDVGPDGTAVLATRGTYRVDVRGGYDAPSGTLRLPLFGNHWSLAAGHRLRLDLTQVDQPFLRPSNPPSSITLSNPKLVLPVHEGKQVTLAGT
jgi:hypothetical protein